MSTDRKSWRLLAATRRLQSRKHLWLRSLKVRCLDCKQVFPDYVLEFDHCRGIKGGNLVAFACSAGWSALKEEVEKCDVVCANCHKIRTYTRGSFRKARRNEEARYALADAGRSDVGQQVRGTGL